MAHPDLVALLKRSVDEWNAWRSKGVLPVGFPPLAPEWRECPDLADAALADSNLARANLSNADLESANLVRANLRGADLDSASLASADLTGAILDRANLFTTALCGAVLFEATLTGAYLHGANLIHADLRGANLRQADFRQANLSDATLVGATLRETSLRQAKLCRTDLGSANLAYAYLNHAIIEFTDFDRAAVQGTTFADLDLRGARNLDTVRHSGPSIIGIETILKSAGGIPETFLRGAGVPEEWITQIPSLIGAIEGIQFYSCFISHSHEDHEFCQRLHSRMQAEHLRVWFAPEDMTWGKKIHEEIETQIRLYDKLLLVLSPASMKSEWVATEIYHARQRELKEGRRILFPIALCPYEEIRAWKCFDADTGKDLAREIREYLIPDDFSQWKDHDAFEAAFAKLLKGLKAEQKPKAS